MVSVMESFEFLPREFATRLSYNVYVYVANHKLKLKNSYLKFQINRVIPWTLGALGNRKFPI